jgi:hypothetical protein
MAEGVGVCYLLCLAELLPCCFRAKGTTPLYYCWGGVVRKRVCVAVEMLEPCGLLWTLNVDESPVG